jgi:chemotaxis protein methyltransferase CheR
MRSELEHVSGLPLGNFRREHVDQQVERACRREQVANG